MKQLHEIFWADVTKVDDSVSVNDNKHSSKYIISGPFMRADFMNRNKRVYTKEAANKAIANLRPMVEEKRIRMLADHPGFYEGPSINLAAGLLLEISDVKEDGYAYYKAMILDTDVGKNLKAILDAGSKVGVSTRGYIPTEGGAEESEWIDSDGTKKKCCKIKDWVLESIDFVDDPAVLDTEIYMKLQTESLQRRKSSMAKTLEEMKSEYPEFCKQLAESAVADTKKEFEGKITELEGKVKTTEDSINNKNSEVDKLVESIKTAYPEKFTIVQESETIKAKDAEIEGLNKKLEEANATIESLNKQISDNKNEYEKKEASAYLESLKVADPDFFALESFKNVFDNCVTKDEIKTVYENNSKIVKEMKEKNQTPAVGKTVQTSESAEKKENNLIDGLTKEQHDDFTARNEMRHFSGLSPMTTEQYLAKFGANAK